MFHVIHGIHNKLSGRYWYMYNIMDNVTFYMEQHLRNSRKKLRDVETNAIRHRLKNAKRNLVILQAGPG